MADSAFTLINFVRMGMKALVAAVLLMTAISCERGNRGGNNAFSVTATFPHDPTAYTQGLFWADSVLFESTGLYGHSDVRRVDLRTGRVLAIAALDNLVKGAAGQMIQCANLMLGLDETAGLPRVGVWP